MVSNEIKNLKLEDAVRFELAKLVRELGGQPSECLDPSSNVTTYDFDDGNEHKLVIQIFRDTEDWFKVLQA